MVFCLGEEQWWISGRYGQLRSLFIRFSFFLFYFRRRKSSGCPLSRFSPAVCSIAVTTWSVATGPKHIIGSLKYEQIFLGWLLALLWSLQQRPLVMLQSLLVRQSSPNPLSPGTGVWQVRPPASDRVQTNPDSQSVSRVQVSPCLRP